MPTNAWVKPLTKSRKAELEKLLSVKVEKGSDKSGHYGHAGRPGEVGGSAKGDGGQSGESATGDRVWKGQQQVSSSKLTKLKTGALGEEMAIRYLEKTMGVDFRTMNEGLNNSPLDAAGDHRAVEVKTGLASNSETAQHWRVTIGEPGKDEADLIKQMSSQEKRTYNNWKMKEIMQRKHSALAEMEKAVGAKVSAATIGIILDPDGSRGDIYYIPGFHQRLSWKEYATDKYYVGTYDVNN